MMAMKVTFEQKAEIYPRLVVVLFLLDRPI